MSTDRQLSGQFVAHASRDGPLPSRIEYQDRGRELINRVSR